ncbi:MAG TPA: hypothetical protein PK891_07290, partial [Bacteroidales bacterium]|nr:hypothetical protein [Bacteroidales bacterium]
FFAFISHYVLDSVIHPYVFYKTEYYDRMYNLSKYNRKHHFYERYIDVYYIDKYKLGKFYKYFFNVKINNDISLLLDSVMDETYNVRNTSKYFKKGLIDAKIMFRFKYDKYGIKNIFYKLFGNKFLSYHIDLNKDKYILNLDHNVWYNPKNGEKHNESVLDLYDIAFDRCCVLLKKVDRCLKNNDFKTFKEIIGNDSYVYGLNLKLGSKLKYLEKECKIDEK